MTTKYTFKRRVPQEVPGAVHLNVNPYTGAKRPTKEELIARMHAFLDGGCHVTFKGVPRKEVIATLQAALEVINVVHVRDQVEHLLNAIDGAK